MTLKQATVTIELDSAAPISLARMLLHASRALDQQAKVEGLTTAEMLDTNLAAVRITATEGIAPIHFKVNDHG